MKKNGIVINAIGDINLGEDPNKYNHGLKKIIKKKGVNYIFHNVENILKTGDIVFGNLECVLSDKSQFTDIRRDFFRGNPEYAVGLKNSGFTILNLLNNHILDHGLIALDETRNSLKKNNINVLDFNISTNKQYFKPLIQKIKNKKICFLTICLNLGTLKSPINVPNFKKIDNEIITIKKNVDIVILSIHWGFEYVPYPSPTQIRIAHHFCDLGVNIIFGHHPHILQPVERYNNSYIIYSLGNFIFDFNQGNTNKSKIFQIEINNTIKISDYSVIINNVGIPSINTKKNKTKYFTSEKLMDQIPFSYEKYALKERKKAKKNRYIYIIKNFWKYTPKWYIYFLKKKIIKNEG